ncbi:hypothetical protein GXW82_17915 [Streptacidiphilus sp. 4-A2]|nr:hypothetical protein [Streptacidiphilus sp. 4-A2]
MLNESDWQRLAEAVGRAKADGQLVAVSVHWGDHTRPWVLTHERLCAQLLAEAGADVVLGHHQHMLRGMDHVSGVPVWYGLGHAVFDQARLAEEYAAYGFDVSAHTPEQLEAVFASTASSRARTGPPSRSTDGPPDRVAVVELGADGVRRCGAVPCLIDADGVARPVAPGTAEWGELTDFLTECQTRAGLSSQVVADTGWQLGGHPVVEFKESP